MLLNLNALIFMVIAPCMVRVKFFGDRTLDVSIVDDHTIDVTTEEPDPILPLMMSTHTMYASSAPFDKNTREAIGTGPFRVADWQTGQRIVLERNDDYWGEPPEVERAEYQWRSESSVRAAMVQQGEADLAPSIAVQTCVAVHTYETPRLHHATAAKPSWSARTWAGVR